ncbi:MAG: response regulator [Candidatus Phaeomarinobacter sp.]
MTSSTDERPVFLVVDDDTDSLRLLRDVLEDAGIAALVAPSGTAALSILSRITPDGILMDAVMPGLDGFETCRQIKQNPEWASIPVIFMTGLKDTENIVRGFTAGGTDYITKPFRVEELTARLLSQITQSRMVRSTRHALDFTGTPLMAVTASGIPSWWNTPADQLLKQLMPGLAISAGVEMPSLSGPLASVALLAVGAAKVEGLTGKTMIAKLLGSVERDEFLIELSIERSDEDTDTSIAALRDSFGLTKREAEVLLWLTRGQANRDIAEIMGCSPRTINKHLEQVFSKMNVENRTAAAMAAVSKL